MDCVERIQKNIPLAPYTTLAVGGHAEYFYTATTREEIHDAMVWAHAHDLPVTILGGGSNVLISDEGVRGLVLRPVVTDISYEDISSNIVYARVGAGVVLDNFIAETVEQGLWGLENLSAIPGTVGAVPVQNVGAYGVEVADRIVSVTVFDMQTRSYITLQPDACMFEYRHSFFKTEKGRHLVIVEVVFCLTRTPRPMITYPDLKNRFQDMVEVSISDVRHAVCEIRSQKFPDWNHNGTAGSFFKNPIVTSDVARALKEKFPEMPQYPVDAQHVKLSLGWILDVVCHLRGYEKDGVSLYKKQALVLVVTQKNVHATTIKNFSAHIQKIVFEKIGLHIEYEVTFIK